MILYMFYAGGGVTYLFKAGLLSTDLASAEDGIYNLQTQQF